ncbi:MAG: DUF4126 domain-containing protein [Steroidobacteraceae bacterium]|nr:DUF4126 domain-containing protein [Steroidobacteraceae bacterium]
MDFTIGSLVGIALGIGLAAATGFRIFIPLLIAGLAARFGVLPLGESFQWLASTPALLTLGTAAVLETLAYYIPGVDHALDVLAGPATLAAGVVASAAVMTEIPPAVMWPLAVIAGGGAAGLTKGSTALLRAKSGMATGGLANPVVSTVETVGATGIAILAIAVPVLCFIGVVALLWWVARKAGRLLFGRRDPPPPPVAT